MIKVQREDFDVGREVKALTDGKHHIGGVVTFVGLVRDLPGAESINSMTLDHYPGMTEKMLAKIEAEAVQRWNLDASLIIHRHGKLQPGDQIVLTVTASAHREAAFEANEFLVDWLKTKAPFWKRESGVNGDKWVDAKDADDEAAARWSR